MATDDQLRPLLKCKDDIIQSLQQRIRELESKLASLQRQSQEEKKELEMSMALLREEASHSLSSMVDAQQERQRMETRYGEREMQLEMQVASQADDLQHLREQLQEEIQAHREDVEASEQRAYTQLRQLQSQLRRAKALGLSASQPAIPTLSSPSHHTLPTARTPQTPAHQPLLQTLSEGLPSYQQSTAMATPPSPYQKAPVTFHTGVTTVDGHMCYFVSFMTNQIHAYDTEEGVWHQLPVCPVSNFGLEVVNNLVTTIGGRLDNKAESVCTTQLFSLSQPSRGGEKGRGRGRGGGGRGGGGWVVKLPPMMLARAQAATASNSRLVIVAGGEIGDHKSFIANIEVLLLETNTWSCVSSSPLGNYSWLSAVVCGDQLYLIEGRGTREKDNVHNIQLGALLEDVYSGPQGAKIKALVWKPVKPAPTSNTTCVSAKDKLIAVGGIDGNGKTSNQIWAYNESSYRWKSIGHIKTYRYRSLVVVTATDSLLVIGGLTKTKPTDHVEIFDLCTQTHP